MEQLTKVKVLNLSTLKDQTTCFDLASVEYIQEITPGVVSMVETTAQRLGIKFRLPKKLCLAKLKNSPVIGSDPVAGPIYSLFFVLEDLDTFFISVNAEKAKRFVNAK